MGRPPIPGRGPRCGRPRARLRHSSSAHVERRGPAPPFEEQRAGRGVGQGHQAFDLLGADDRGGNVGCGQVHVGQVGDRERLKRDDGSTMTATCSTSPSAPRTATPPPSTPPPTTQSGTTRHTPGSRLANSTPAMPSTPPPTATSTSVWLGGMARAMVDGASAEPTYWMRATSSAAFRWTRLWCAASISAMRLCSEVALAGVISWVGPQAGLRWTFDGVGPFAGWVWPAAAADVGGPAPLVSESARALFRRWVSAVR